MRTLQISARRLLEDLSGVRDERVAKYLERATRRQNPAAARVDLKDARACLTPPENREQARALERLDAILHPAPGGRRARISAEEAKDARDWYWCMLCGEDAVRFFRSYRGLVPVCERHAPHHVRAHILSLIHRTMSAGFAALAGLVEESTVHSLFEDASEASHYSSSNSWPVWLQAWWKTVAADEGVIWAWSYLTTPNLEMDVSYPSAVVQDFRARLYEIVETHCTHRVARSSQQNGRKGGRPPAITPAQIRKVRQLAAKGRRQVEIAAEAGLSQSRVSRLLRTFK